MSNGRRVLWWGGSGLKVRVREVRIIWHAIFAQPKKLFQLACVIGWLVFYGLSVWSPSGVVIWNMLMSHCIWAKSANSFECLNWNDHFNHWLYREGRHISISKMECILLISLFWGESLLKAHKIVAMDLVRKLSNNKIAITSPWRIKKQCCPN